MAIPLTGGEHLPGSIPSFVAASEHGEITVGPLDFDAQVKAALNSDLESSKLAIVETSHQDYLVEFLPGAARSRSARSTNPVDEISHLLSNGSTRLSKFTQSGLNELDKLLNISGSTASNAKPSLNLEPQVLGSVLPPPIPEPSAWVIFSALLVAAAGLRRLTARRAMAGD
jgi:hypothetical protein